jgi:acetyl esterase/lipase
MRSVAVVAFTYWASILTAIHAQPQQIPPVVVAPPGETGRRVTDDGLVGNYFPASRRGPGVLVLAGSVGGLSVPANDFSKALQAEGYNVLHLSYFRAPGQSPHLELFPLEYFDTALAWLRRQPEVDAARIGIIGMSKGAEAALLVAVRHPELKAVIAALPSSVVWPGIVWEGTTEKIRSSWTERGQPLPHLPHVPYDARKGGTVADNYAESLKMFTQHPEAGIPVERIAGPLFLVCGELDEVWPSCPMARQIQDRLREHRRPEATLLAYKEAGHRAFGAPLPPGHPALAKDENLNTVLVDVWKRALAFLAAHLSAPPGRR